MSFDNAIKHGKTRRKPYKGGKAVDLSCRNHGGCPICEGNRLHSDKMREQASEEQLKEEKQ
jgi:hypothetical protein